MDIFGQGLSDSFNRLNKHPNAYDADHGGWDISYRDGEPERDFMKDGLAEMYHAGVDMLFNLAQCPLVFVGGYLYQLAFQPSGWYLTTVTNTLKNYRQVCESFMDIYHEVHGEHCSIQYMRDNLELLCGGDDLAFSTRCPWFTITAYALWAEKRGIYVESDVLDPRNAMDLTFFSHRLYPRSVSFWKDKKIAVAGGRLDKIISSFSYLKTKDGKVDYCANAMRVASLLVNLWAYEEVFNYLEPYASHLIYQYFYDSGRVLTKEWQSIFNALPNEQRMLTMWRKGRSEGYFFPDEIKQSTSKGVHEYQSVLKDPHVDLMQSYATPLFKSFPAAPKKAARKSTKKGKAPARRVAAGTVITQPVARPRKRGGRKGRGSRRQNGSGPNNLGGMFPTWSSGRGKRVATVIQDEYIGLVAGNTAGGFTSYAVNPGQAGTFPWLAKEAAQWEKYEFRALEFYYRPRVSGFATAGTTGRVVLSADYDASDPIPTTQQQMEDTDPHSDFMPYQSGNLILDPREMHRNSDAKFVRIGPQPARTDLKTYDCAVLNVGVFDTANTANIGELRVRYKVDFSIPVLEPNAAPTNTSTTMLVSSGEEGVTTDVPYQLLLATTDTNGLKATNTNGSVVWPLGNYLYTWLIQGSSTSYWTSMIGSFELGATTLTTNVQAQSETALTTECTVGATGWFTSDGVTATTLLVIPIGAGTLAVSGVLTVTAV